LALLGGLVSLQQLDMTGCRTATGSKTYEEMEQKIWAAIKAERRKRKLRI
jgi:hypothetical protein